jgi:AbrB family looped-hinge helix DNA binding protein
MAESIDIGTVSVRGQVAIPAEIRERMHLQEGEKVLFVLEGDALLVKKVSSLSWDEVTRPLREAAHRAGLKESDVPRIVEQVRKRKR